MKALLTGASGFVGSHLLDSLCEQGLETAILLRPSSDRRFISSHASLEVRTGSITDPDSLLKALDGISHVIHCAGCTRASRYSQFYEINDLGLRNVVAAVNARQDQVRRLIHISSLAVTGPATVTRPAREEDPSKPISEYGKSKLAGELEVKDNCRVEFVVLRPPAVYGPRDNVFLPMFQAVKKHLLPRPNGRQALSLVFVKDLAQAVVRCLTHPAAGGKTYFVASREIVTARQMAQEIASRMQHWTVPVPLPAAALLPLCLAQEAWSRMTGKPTLLNLQKFAELRAPGWVCDPSRFEREIGVKCETSLKSGILETLSWYKAQEWL
jgi:nucleoside-diphosphate-sugar epimerase